jgi:hypothetical protein
MNRSCQKAFVATAHQHGRTTLAGFKNKKWGLPKEKRRKAEQNESPDREGHAGWAGRVKNFRASAMLKTTPPGCERKAT